MALLRGDGSPYHSRVIWWQEENVAGIIGGQWGWKSNAGTADCSTYPDSALIELALPDPATNIFCAGLTQTARGMLAVVGGTEPGTENGMRTMKIFRAGGGDSSGTWTECDSMANWRYYPTATTLADGRIAAFSGSRFQHTDLFGGRKNGEALPTQDALLRFGPAFKGIWETSIENPHGGVNWPKPLTRATAVRVPAYSAVLLFGGRDSSGTLENDVNGLYRNYTEDHTDYSYVWTLLNPPIGLDRPDPRMDHVAVVVDFDTSVIIMGGLAKHQLQSEATTNDVWRHFLAVNPTTHKKEYHWDQMKIGGTPPSARMGHSAFFDADSSRMLVFGGRSSPSADPDDSTVYALNFDKTKPDTAWWSIPTVWSYDNPPPRYGQSMQADVSARKYGATSLKSGVLFGGQGVDTTYNDVWRLWILQNGDLRWERVSTQGTPPSARFNHTGTYESGSGRLMVFGGESASGPADDAIWVLDFDETPTPTWRPFASLGYSLAGQVAAFDNIAYSLSPEIFTESTNSWEQNSHGHAQQWYPQMFQMKNGKVFQAGPSLLSYTFDPSDATWAQFPPADTCEIYGGGAVMYEPDKVMKCGARDTEYGTTAVRTTQYLDLDAPSPTWTTCDSMAFGRVNHNLVLLPNGKVLMTGGLGVAIDNHNIDPRLRPEIWDPATHAWSILSDGDSLAASTVPRGYHSTAILLPDARVLCAGGNATFVKNQTEVTDSSQIHGDVFCPPYLFNSDGSLATRPVLLSTTGRWRYGWDVTFAVSGNTTVQNVCLIHACATTHAQDEAQRYIPLSVESSTYANGVRQYFLKAPPDSFTAPPGDYLLFVSDSVGVPSIAQWVRVGFDEDGLLDTTAPDQLTFSTTFVFCDSISPIYWTAPGDDESSGTALDYDIRYSDAPIDSISFYDATSLAGVGMPLLAGTIQTGQGFGGLPSASSIYIAGYATDKAGHFSHLTVTQFGTLSSCGGGGFGTSAGRSRDESGSGRSAQSGAGADSRLRGLATPAGMLPNDSPLRLVASFNQSGHRNWTISYEDLSADPDLLELTSQKAVIQDLSADGTWMTRRSPGLPGGSVGVRTLPRNGRIVFPSTSTLQAFNVEPRGFVCASARHSRLGDLLDASGSGTIQDFVAGDTLSLSYAAEDTSSADADWFFQAQIPGNALTTASRTQPHLNPQPEAGTSLPTEFALHPVQPNPFSNTTSVRFDLPRGSRVQIEVFDVLGRRVTRLANARFEAGRHVVTWNGSTDSGGRAPAGVYLCRMTADGFRAERRISLVP